MLRGESDCYQATLTPGRRSLIASVHLVAVLEKNVSSGNTTSFLLIIAWVATDSPD